MILVHYLADLRRRWHIQEYGQPFEDDAPEPYALPDDTQPAAFVQALEAALAAHARDKEARHIYADMILCDLLLWSMNNHEDGDVVSAAHAFVERYQAIEKWYA